MSLVIFIFIFISVFIWYILFSEFIKLSGAKQLLFKLGIPNLFAIIEIDIAFLFIDVILLGLNSEKKFEMSIHYIGNFKT